MSPHIFKKRGEKRGKMEIIKKSNKGVFIIALIFLLFITFSYQTFAEDIYKQNKEIDLKISCINQNTKSYCSIDSECNITIYNPDSSLIISNRVMQNQISFHNYTLNSTYTNQNGNYAGNVLCVDGSNSQTQDFSFLVTPSGYNPTITEGLLAGFLLILCVFIWILCINGYSTIRDNHEYDLGGNLMKVNFNKYIKMGLGFLAYLFFIIVIYMAWKISLKYLMVDFAFTIFDTIFTILWISVPIVFIIFIVTTFIKVVADMKLWELANRNLKPYGGKRR